MRLKYKKTIVYTIIISILVYFLLNFLYYGEINPKIPFMSERTIQVSSNDIIKGLNGYQIEEGIMTSITDDSWLELQLKTRSYIGRLEISSDYIENFGEIIQTYYSSDKEFVDNIYIETILNQKNTAVTFPGKDKIKTIRIDLSSKEGIRMNVPVIKIVLLNKQMKEFLILFSIILIICLGIMFAKVNNSFIRYQIDKKIKLKERFEFIDQIVSLAISDFKSRFSGSYLGMVWGVLQPLSTILLFWFVFQIGFRSKPMGNVPFILWLVAGMIPWNFFYDAWFGGTNAFTSYGYIVKKVVFRIEILPFIKVLSSFFLNIVFNGILLLIYILYGRFPGIHILDLVYYNICLFSLCLGLSYLTATLNVFMKDVGQLMGIVLQFLMWLTPLMWDYKMAEKYSLLYKLNPIHYILNGYRESMIDGKWFYENIQGTIWFWSVTVLFSIIGIYTMKKLKPHFADVL